MLLVLTIGLGAATCACQGARFADYWPLDYGYWWTLQNPLDPNDHFTWFAFHTPSPDPGTASLGPVVALGEPLGHFLATNDGIVFGLHASGNVVGLNDFDDVYLGDVPDGYTFTTSPTDQSMIRKWDVLKTQLTPAQLAPYAIDPQLTGLLVWVWYDTAVTTSNAHNTSMETALPPGVVPPPGSVTDIDWLQRGAGPITSWSVDAGSGALGPRYDQVARFVDCNGNLINDALDIQSGFSQDANGNGIPDACDIDVPPLFPDVLDIHLATGGTQNLALKAGPAQGSRPYVLLGSLSGISPGMNVGTLILPLNFDPYTQWTLHHPNHPLLPGSSAVLSPAGNAMAQIALPPGLPPTLAGTVLHHAFAVIDTSVGVVSFTSNPIPLVLR